MGKLHYKESPSEKEKQAFGKYLAEDEELILATGLSPSYLYSRLAVFLIWPGIIFILTGFVLAYFIQSNLGFGLLAGLIMALLVAIFKTYHLHHAHRYLLTTRRVIIKKGILAVQITSTLYDKITHIDVDQPFFDKVFMKQGTIVVNTAGMNKGEITLDHVAHPIEFKNLLERLINREREIFGGRPASTVTVEGELLE